jgi:hypothetical protein
LSLAIFLFMHHLHEKIPSAGEKVQGFYSRWNLVWSVPDGDDAETLQADLDGAGRAFVRAGDQRNVLARFALLADFLLLIPRPWGERLRIFLSRLRDDGPSSESARKTIV